MSFIKYLNVTIKKIIFLSSQNKNGKKENDNLKNAIFLV